MSGFFTTPLSEADPEIFGSITDELGRQRNEIELIASFRTTYGDPWNEGTSVIVWRPS